MFGQWQKGAHEGKGDGQDGGAATLVDVLAQQLNVVGKGVGAAACQWDGVGVAAVVLGKDGESLGDFANGNGLDDLATTIG